MLKVGLVLCGGMVKGAYQIGVLKALREFIDRENIKYVSATSIGTIVAYSYLQDKLDMFEQLWLEHEQFNVRSFLRSPLKRSNILDEVSKIAENHQKIESDFFVTCLDINKMHLDYVNLKNVNESQIEDYLKAAISFSPMFKAIEIGNSKYIDGAVIDNIPVKPLANCDFDYIIVVHFDKDNYVYPNLKNKNIIEINFDVTTSISKSLSFNEESSRLMIHKGYSTAKQIFSLIFAEGIDNMKYITNSINYLNQNFTQKNYIISVDVLMDRLNSFTKKFVYNDIKQNT